MNDHDVRAWVYDVTMASGKPPLIAEIARHFGASEAEVIDALERLASGRIFVLQRETNELLMVPPFSAVATPFVVESGGVSYFANCIWDALGVPVMLHRDAEIHASCGDCGTAMSVRADNGVAHGDGLVHFAIPARQWWNDIVFTWKTMLYFRSEEHIERWCESWRMGRGAVMPLDLAWRLALAWFSADRRAPEWRRRTVDEVEEVFGDLGLSSPFWSLR